MKQARHIIVAVVATMAAPAFAQDDGTGPRGNFELEYLRSDGSSDVLLYGDLGFSYRGAGAGGIGLGFDLGLDSSYNLSEGDNATAFIAAAVFSFGFGDLAVGMPQSIGEMLVNRPSFAGNGGVDEVLGLLVPPATGNIARLSDLNRFGVRFDASAGQLRYGLSAHKTQDLDGMVLQAAGEYALGQGAVEGLLELDTETGKPGGTVGVTQSFGQVDVGAYLGWQRTIVRSDSIHASVDYHMSDNLTFGGDFARVSLVGAQTNIYGASMEYGFGNGAYGQLGIVDGSDTSATYDLSVGIRF